MNKKEVNELRRRLAPEKCAISKIYGCYVNGAKEIVSEVDIPLGAVSEDDAASYLALLKKSLSGTLGKNLIDIVFSTQQVLDSEEHRLLSALRESALADEEIRQQFYRCVTEALDMDGENYVILLAHDTYDVPYRGKDGEKQVDASDQVYSYILCCICPVKDSKPQLSYCADEKNFRNRTVGRIAAAPVLGFLFPAFDNRQANLYNALYYTKSTSDLHQEFIDHIFHIEAPMSAEEQREVFFTALSEALGENCGFPVVQTIHEQLRAKIEAHKESKDPEQLDISLTDIERILSDCGVAESDVASFHDLCTQQFGDNAVLNPGNLINEKRFEIQAEGVKALVDPELSHLVEVQEVNGKTYIMLPADGTIDVNGVSI